MTGRTSLVSPVTEKREVSAGRTAWRQVMRPCLCKEGAQEPLQGAGNVFYSLWVRQVLAEACPARRPVGWRPACRRGPSCTPGGGGQVLGCVPLPLLSLMPGARSPTGQPVSRVTGDSFVGGPGCCGFGFCVSLSAELTHASRSVLLESFSFLLWSPP